MITENFLLSNSSSERLYNEYAKDMPIIDYHCHLPPDQIAENKQFDNITQAWLYGDHYKWRAMRTNGVDERFCTGDASDKEKFLAYAATVPKTLRNPLYHWTHLELQRYFGVSTLLSSATADKIWSAANEQMPELTTQHLLTMMNVRVVGTTDDPTDLLEHHRSIAAQNLAGTFPVKVAPTFRPDKAMAVENVEAFHKYTDKLASTANVDITSFPTFIEALQKRHDFFAEHGCKLSDHGLEQVYAEDYTAEEIEQSFQNLRRSKALEASQILKFKSAVLYEICLMNHAKGWTQQLHLGALRNNNSRMMRTLGADTGFDSIGDFPQARSLARFLDRLDTNNQLAKTILYNLNPADNNVFATMIGNFQDGTIAGKLQYGSGWWFLDQLDGMRRQIDALSNMGLLSRFVGMLTDSRSFLSYPRHEYFRRLLCDLLGSEMQRGLLPMDVELIGGMVRDICYNNAESYFGFELPETNSQTAQKLTFAQNGNH
jgi:glucuronate isomerase